MIDRAAYIGGMHITDDTVVEPVKVAGRLVGVLKNGTFMLLMTDPRGTVLAGDDKERFLATPYGVRARHPELAEALDFVEKGYDRDLGMVRMGVRDYDSYLSMFTSPDPLYFEGIGELLKSPWEGNLYGYALGDPISYTDPTGENARPTRAARAPTRPRTDPFVARQVNHLISLIRQIDPHFRYDSLTPANAPAFSRRDVKNLQQHLTNTILKTGVRPTPGENRTSHYGAVRGNGRTPPARPESPGLVGNGGLGNLKSLFEACGYLS